MICHSPPTTTSPGHYYTIVPRGRTLYLVDEDHAIRRLNGEARNKVFSQVALIFMARLQYEKNADSTEPEEKQDSENPPAQTAATEGTETVAGENDDAGRPSWHETIAQRVVRKKSGKGTETPTMLSVGQLNIAGLTRTKAELLSREVQNDILCLQEIKGNAKPTGSKFDVFDQQRRRADGTGNNHGGGASIWVSKTLGHAVSRIALPPSPHCDAVAVLITGATSSFAVVSLYIPPQTSIALIAPYLQRLMGVHERVLMCGDVNVHSTDWYAQSSLQITNNANALVFLETLQEQGMSIENDLLRYTRVGHHEGAAIL
eukprot:PhM_4_TR16781/c0_g2_i2/m.103535